MRKVDSKDSLMELARGWQGSVVFLTACRLDVFSYLNNFIFSKELAEILHVKERYLDRLLNTLVVLGLVEKRDSKFRNTPLANKYLDKKSEDYLLGLIHSYHMMYYWSFLFDVVKEGVPSRELPFIKPVDNWLEPFISAMQQYASERAPVIVDLIDFSGVDKFLDLGGGSGAISVEVVKRYPSVDVVIFDLPEVIPITKRFVSRTEGMSNISFLEGDYLKDNIQGQYDLILLSNIIHAHGEEEIVKVLKKCNKALKPDGSVVIHDFLINEGRVSPPWAVFFAINMLVNTENGDTYTLNEIKGMLNKAGFEFLNHSQTGKNSDIVIAKN